MAIKKYKPTTPGRRGMTVTDYSVLSKVDPERSLLESKKKHAGRNNTGKITVRHHGGGNRVKYRVIDFKRNKFDVPATVKTLEYDPNRYAFIASISLKVVLFPFLSNSCITQLERAITLYIVSKIVRKGDSSPVYFNVASVGKSRVFPHTTSHAAPCSQNSSRPYTAS